MSQSLEELLKTKSPVDLLRNSQIGAYVYPVVPAEYTNWRDEQRAWRDSCVLFDQSHHMANVYMEGPDAVKLASYLGFNSFAKFPVDRAKQLAPCSYDGHVIGDGILFHLEPDKLVFVGRAPAASWIQFQAETGRIQSHYAVGRPVALESRRKSGDPHLLPLPDSGAERLEGDRKAERRPAPGNQVLRHGLHQHRWTEGARVAARHGGRSGLEIWGPYEEREEIRAAIVEAGKEFGLAQVGSRAYATNTLRIGLDSFAAAGRLHGRQDEGLPASGCRRASYEGTGSLGGSFVSKNIEDYYVTPYEMGYGPFVKFDHDFIGREALEKISKEPQRKKVTFAWNAEDVAKVQRSMLRADRTALQVHRPAVIELRFGLLRSSVDRRETGGLSMFSGYSYNEGSMLSLGIVEHDVQIGTEVTLVWGEEGGGTKKATVERHKQTEIRAVVSPVPYAKTAREEYASGWRTAAQ